MREPAPRNRSGQRIARLALSALLVALTILFGNPAAAVANLNKFLQKASPSELVPGADRFGPIEGTRPFARLYKGGEEVGFALLNTDFVTAIGYSGKPIHVLVGLDVDGTITGVKLVKHSEPIVLIGIPEKRVVDFMAGYVGLNVRDLAGKVRDSRSVDVISGATVTVMVIEDSILRSSVKLARALNLAGLGGQTAAAPAVIKRIDKGLPGTDDWSTLLGDGTVRHRRLSIGEINEAFDGLNNPEASARPEPGTPGEVFIHLHMAPVSIPLIGRSLLGDAEYKLMAERLKPGQQAVLIFANGRYSFKGSGYVRGGVFDRIQLIQGENGVRFRDKYHKRLGDVLATGAPRFKEVALFVLPEEVPFDVTEPFRLELLVHRAVGPVKKVFLAFDLDYRLPGRYVIVETPPKPAASASASSATADLDEDSEENQLWKRLWENRVVDVVILVAALVFLTIVFFFQDMLARYPKLTDRVRLAFLVFTTVWIGFYAQAQLSVVNVLTFFNALVTDFRWQYFLMEPMIFILWCAVAASLIFWGRGAYCGWLCPFGALQELLNRMAKWAKVPQLRLPWGLHERLWPLKYLIFLGLFGLSFYSLGFAEELAEVEPFKTSIILKFVRDWPFVLYAVVLLVIGLFIERFFCRYLCPLGAALAIPGRMRTFDWLKRHKECGSLCQICANECMVQAIHPEGHINPNECLYCLNCQTLYWDDHRCPPVIQRRERRERRLALSTKTGAAGSDRGSMETPATNGPVP
ncbi:MAG: NosR/NirI family protein [Rhodospirillales bacterium]|nr:NosR/NirI family protein [Rhodospirillales bacterium]